MVNVPNRAPWVNVAVGILAIISPFIFASTSMGARWDLVITGVIIAVVAIIELAVYPNSTNMHYWPVINILAGIWLCISTAFVPNEMGMIWSNIVLGVTAIVTAAIALSYESLHSHAPR